MAITSLWYRCILLQPLRIEKDSRVASIDFTGEKDSRVASAYLQWEKDCRVANTPPEKENERVANTYLQWEKE